VGEFADGLEAVLTDRDLARRLGAEAQRRVESTFSWQQRVVDVERAYRAARTGRGEQ
jgi:glycosyltransferase involved in cell wall biosynthesis